MLTKKKVELRKSRDNGRWENVWTNNLNRGQFSSLIYAALNCQFPAASSADSLIGQGMIAAWTQSKPGMMDGLGIQQLGSAGVKESLNWAESLAQLACNFHKSQSPRTVCI